MPWPLILSLLLLALAPYLLLQASSLIPAPIAEVSGSISAEYNPIGAKFVLVAFTDVQGKRYVGFIDGERFKLALPPGRYALSVTWNGHDAWEYGSFDVGYVVVPKEGAHLNVTAFCPGLGCYGSLTPNP